MVSNILQVILYDIRGSKANKEKQLKKKNN